MSLDPSKNKLPPLPEEIEILRERIRNLEAQIQELGKRCLILEGEKNGVLSCFRSLLERKP